MTTCANCGRENAPGVQFCVHCGEYLGWQPGGDAVPAESSQQSDYPAWADFEESEPATSQAEHADSTPVAAEALPGDRPQRDVDQQTWPWPSAKSGAGSEAELDPAGELDESGGQPDAELSARFDPAETVATAEPFSAEPPDVQPARPALTDSNPRLVELSAEVAELSPGRVEPGPQVGEPTQQVVELSPPAEPVAELDVHAELAAEPPGRTAAEPPAPDAPRSLIRVVSALDEGRRLAEQHQRPDIGQHLAVARERLAGQVLGVAVVGEFKRGKSTLVNAILQTDICPVDADIVTAVPTLVRYGPAPAAVAYLEPQTPAPRAPVVPGQPPVPATIEEPVDVDQLAELVSEAGASPWRRRLRSVEVQLPHRILRTGLCLVDTPGVGGLDSAHGVVTLGALGSACAMIFVTDASQELTAPELDFLRQALERCPAAICVVTKTDLYPEWRRIVELDRQHLSDAGIDVPIVGVSSFLRLRAWRLQELNEESGFAELFDWLREDVVEAAAAEAVTAASRDLGFAQQQLAIEVDAEREVLVRPETTEQVVTELRQRTERTRRLVDGSTGWQQFLADGAEDLFADVRHDLTERMRTLARDVEGVIDQSDPKQSWPDIEVWLQRQVVQAATANFDLLNERAEQLAADVAESFALESAVPLELGLTAPVEVLRGLTLDPATTGDGGAKVVRMVFAGRTAILVPSLVFGLLGSNLLLIAAMGPLSLLLGAGIGRKLLRDERQRQLLYRRQQAKIACRKYLDEAAFVVGKDCQDSLRHTRRELRDEFQSRAGVLHASSERALSSAESAAALDPAQRATRVHELAARRREIDRLSEAAAAAAGARAGAA